MSVLLRRAALEGLLCGPPSLVPSLLVRPNSGELGEGEGRTGGASQPLLAHVRTRSGRGAPQQPDSPGGLDTTRGGKKGGGLGAQLFRKVQAGGARSRQDPARSLHPFPTTHCHPTPTPAAHHPRSLRGREAPEQEEARGLVATLGGDGGPSRPGAPEGGVHSPQKNTPHGTTALETFTWPCVRIAVPVWGPGSVSVRGPMP